MNRPGFIGDRFAMKEAERLYAQNPSIYTDKITGKIEVPINFNRAVGHGYMGRNQTNKDLGIAGGEYRWTNTVTVELGKVTKKPYTVYPDLSKGIAKPDPIKY